MRADQSINMKHKDRSLGFDLLTKRGATGTGKAGRVRSSSSSSSSDVSSSISCSLFQFQCSVMSILGIFITLTALGSVTFFLMSTSNHHISLSNTIHFLSKSSQEREQLAKFSNFDGLSLGLRDTDTDTILSNTNQPIKSSLSPPLLAVSGASPPADTNIKAANSKIATGEVDNKLKIATGEVDNKFPLLLRGVTLTPLLTGNTAIEGLSSESKKKNHEIVKDNIITPPKRIIDRKSDKKIEGNIGSERLSLNNDPSNNLEPNTLTSSQTATTDIASLYKIQTQKRLSLVTERLKNHPIFTNYHPNDPLEDVMYLISQTKACADKPIFTGMASVSSDIYWQLIENFVYSMLKFDLVECSFLICVSDLDCMEKCKRSSFPCYNYDYFYYHPENKGRADPVSPMEQIATLKLFELPKALAKGVSIFIVDLDVGFLDDPMGLVQNFMKPENKIDIYVQKDISFVMDRSEKGWRTWFTVPLPNIGIFLCKGNVKTTIMFDIAWKDYLTIEKPIKMNPGKDQNKVVSALHTASAEHGLKWRYFDNNETVLLDKIFKFVTEEYELGGTAADSTLRQFGAIAAHTTCYDSTTKVMGLKASNAFWNPFYYDYNRRTVTKKLLYVTEKELLQEVRSLVYLALATNRTLIIPNVLGFNSLENIRYGDKTFWPSFRVLHSTDDLIRNTIIESQFYWRMARDYSASISSEINSDKKAIPPATIVDFNRSHTTIGHIEALLQSDQYSCATRIVLNGEKLGSKHSADFRGVISRRRLGLEAWADDPLEGYDSYSIESRNYMFLPRIDGNRLSLYRNSEFKRNLVYKIIYATRLCRRIFSPNQGNRSCFDKCR